MNEILMNKLEEIRLNRINFYSIPNSEIDSNKFFDYRKGLAMGYNQAISDLWELINNETEK